jgi:nanoRNase/pAp phosphatase (c-di-AMP/oligoRNAs hydrolase)
MTSPTNWPEAARAIDAAASILLVTHVNPDGDAIGAAVLTLPLTAACLIF